MRKSFSYWDENTIESYLEHSAQLTRYDKFKRDAQYNFPSKQPQLLCFYLGQPS